MEIRYGIKQIKADANSGIFQVLYVDKRTHEEHIKNLDLNKENSKLGVELTEILQKYINEEHINLNNK